ncbi:helix-turn-helix domain-containing protein [Aeromicrobium tamlense]|uniref:helix-turn-helix domain-containing protein n=1 Tax=Aeromicrobium tamlense TaxID=375541 RepID=UPI001CBF62F6
MTSADAAAHLGVAEGTVSSWRARGVGPRHLTLARRVHLYRAEDLDSWRKLNAGS